MPSISILVQKCKGSTRTPSLLKAIARALLEACFPPLCVACEGRDLPVGRPLCSVCYDHLTLLTYKPWNRCASCFLPSPISRGLLRAHPDTIAAFLVVQFVELGWPLPDVVMAQERRDVVRCFAKRIGRPLVRRYPFGSTVLGVSPFSPKRFPHAWLKRASAFYSLSLIKRNSLEPIS